MRILLVEDEEDLNSVITRFLKKNNYSVDSIFDGEKVFEFLKYEKYDLIILDIMIPKMSGFQVVERLREIRNNTPVLILTARETVEDRVKGLDLGADDYLVKPFDFNELIARIRALIRRKYGNISNRIVVGDLEIDVSDKRVARKGETIDLTAKEYEILEYLALNTNRIMTREQIKSHVWDYDYEGASNIIDVLVKNIRKKIHIENGEQIIRTKRGMGYVIYSDSEKGKK